MEHKTTEMLAQEAEKLWGGIQGKTLIPKDRAAIPQQNMPSRNPEPLFLLADGK